MKTTEQDLLGWEGRRFAIPKAGPEARPRRTCPLHTPALTASVPGGGYETECLVCGARGPKARNHCRGEAGLRRWPRSVGFRESQTPEAWFPRTLLTGELSFRESRISEAQFPRIRLIGNPLNKR
jgi:hypothetical protein